MKEPDNEPNEKSFEDHLVALEAAIARLEAPDTALEESLAVYAAAMKHLAACHAVLDGAEKRLELVRAGSGDVVAAELDDRGSVAPVE